MADIQDKINEILKQSRGFATGAKPRRAARSCRKRTRNHSLPKRKNELSLPTDFMNDDIAKSLIKILPAVKSIGCEDDTTRLLNALRPFLSCEKQEKLDKAGKMLKLFKILPLLKDINIF